MGATWYLRPGHPPSEARQGFCAPGATNAVRWSGAAGEKRLRQSMFREIDARECTNPKRRVYTRD